ncbi:DUF2529 domain-containing protein [Bacillus sp. AFS031507]|uniref:DUF2529 domain-containing protein n=1 Tax=Bacillus sp. AFS031507 TaxID=2033496 RepID=UPI000BFBB2F1|nr:DUF2529 domain-containing protein [Bacillus sp. AFS031507]PGY12500.1 hypothetical protein COE25_09020 [Bacillus sp. AFS031507]
MLKMFTTQLTGLLKRIEEKEEYSFEDGARLLAQGPIYIFATKEMKAVEFEALEGAEPLKDANVLSLESFGELTDSDRVLLFSRYASDEDAMEVAAQLQEKAIPFVAVSTAVPEGGKLQELADLHIDLRLTKGLLPDDFGNRYGYPSSMAALFVYFGLKFTIEEILAEYEE